MDPPLDESALRYRELRDGLLGNEVEMETPEDDTGFSLNKSIILSGITHIDLPIVRRSRRQWRWLQWFLWIVPTLWTTTIYLTQLFFGMSSLAFGVDPQVRRLAAFNLIAGIIGVTAASLRIWDNWFFVKPAAWIRPEEIEEPEPACCREWSLFLVLFILDIVLFVWNIVGSVWAFTLYGSDWVHPEAIAAFTVAFLILAWSRFGLVMFSLKLILSYKSVALLRVLRLA